MSTLQDLRQTRLDKLEKIRQLGLDPYPAQSQKDFPNSKITSNFDEFNGKIVTLAGRIMSWRGHGAIAFANIQDQSGSIQLFIRQNHLNPTDSSSQRLGYDALHLLDIGDFIQATGPVVKTSTGEVSLDVTDLKLLTKSIRPLPEKWQGIKDRELIFRRRYLDLIMNQDRQQLFIRKAKFWQLTRQFLQSQGFMEVETPVMELITGGADAKPFVTHHNALDQDFYLRISTELYQKRLIGGGYEKIYTLGPNFRNEGIDDEHLQEYYQCEWYWAYADYTNNMDLVEQLFQHIAQNLYAKTIFTRGKHTFDLSGHWPRLSYGQVIKDRFSVDIYQDSEEKILSLLKQQKIDTSGLTNRARIVDNLWKIVRADIAGPIFIIDEPKFASPLAKSKPDAPELTQRFHCIIAGSELGNGYSELNDPLDQLARFQEQQQARDAGDAESQMLDIDFVEMLEYGMPPVSGWGHSERVFWFLENVTAREGTFFPQMKFDLTDETRKIYNLPIEEKIGLKNNLVVIGKVLGVAPHPNADSLKIWNVTIADNQALNIISSCQNLKIGDIVPVALNNAVVFAPDHKTQKIKKSKMRGVESIAMMCSPLELGLSEVHDGIFILPANLESHLGEPVHKYFAVK